MPVMLGCSTTCPKCKHEFACCPSVQTCCSVRRSLHVLSGGGLVTTTLAATAPLSPCLSPQVSPSVPLAFILPPFAAQLSFPLPPPLDSRPEEELQSLAHTVQALRLSGWFYEGMNYPVVNELLKDTSPGTFLVRNSSDPRYLFALSVQTERGPTSVRLYYNDGYFRLDAQAHVQAAMPLFRGVVELVQHYVKQGQKCRNNSQVWVDLHGKLYSPILLTRPLLKKRQPQKLKHLARLAIHRSLENAGRSREPLSSPHTQLELPTSLTAYLGEYPYSV